MDQQQVEDFARAEKVSRMIDAVLPVATTEYIISLAQYTQTELTLLERRTDQAKARFERVKQIATPVEIAEIQEQIKVIELLVESTRADIKRMTAELERRGASLGV